MPPKPRFTASILTASILAGSRRSLAAALASLALICSSRPAAACPSCAPSLAARAQIFDDGFFRNLAVALLPFVLVGAVCARAQHIGRPRR